MTSSCSFARYMYTCFMLHKHLHDSHTSTHAHALRLPRCPGLCSCQPPIFLAHTAPFSTPSFWHRLTRSPMVAMSPQLPMSSTMLD